MNYEWYLSDINNYTTNFEDEYYSGLCTVADSDWSVAYYFQHEDYR